MASGIVSSVLARISNLLSLIRSSPSSSSNQANRVLRDLKELEIMLRKIRAALHHAEEREIREQTVKLWLMELKHVAYDAEDVLGEYEYEVLRAQVEGRVPAVAASRERKLEEISILTLASSVLSEVTIPYGIEKRIKKIKDNFDEISRDREALQLREEDGKRRSDGTAKYRQTTSHMVKSQVYGRESDKEKVIQRLFSDTSSRFCVIAVVGKGGLGKTTLAQLVYNDEGVSRYFDLKIWICVSDDFDVVRLTKEMIEYDTMRSCASSELKLLQDNLKRKLNGKKLLLVLDDVWNDQKRLWDSLRDPLNAAELVRVVVTTRNDSVAMTMQAEDPPYRLNYLGEDHSWQLFQCHAFYGRNPNELPNLVEIGKMIVKRCGGLPLAVKSLGGLLQHDFNEESWEDVLQSELWELNEEKQILPALKLSYSRMPSHLKPCFLYCSIFPKDHPFSKEELVRLWMAQGYIQARDGRSMEDMACEYFDELHNRSFFDPHIDDQFKLHDSIHDMARHASGNEFHAIVNPEQCDNLDEVRHLYFVTDKELMKSISCKKLRPLRTLLCYTLRYDDLEYTYLKFVLSMTSLRALYMTDLGLKELPESIGNLKHLRYLHLFSCEVVRLPGSLGHLFNLQLLSLECERLKELPCEIGSLINLHCLSLKHCASIENLPASMSGLYSLRTLDLSSCVDLGSLPEWISQLCSLQKLCLSWCESLRELPSTVGNLRNLKYLDISGSFITSSLPVGIWKLNKMESFITDVIDVRRDFMPRGIGEFEEWVNLTGLEIIGLQNVNIEEAKGANVKSKHKLKRLHLTWGTYVQPLYTGFKPLLQLRVNSEGDNKILVDEETMATVLESLQPHSNLEELHIMGYKGARYPSWIDEPSFNQLTQVILFECGNEKMTCLPAFGQLPSLQHLILKKVSHLKSIGGEFCRCIPGVNKTSEANEVAFPSLRMLDFEDMPCWEEWHGVLHGDLPLLQKLEVTRCPRLRTLPTLPPKLRDVHLGECPKLSSLSGLPDLCHLRNLYLVGCHQLRLPANIPLLAKFEKVNIYNCLNLSFLLGPQNVNYLEELHVLGCAELHLPANNFLSSTLTSLHIEDCLNPSVLPQPHNLNSLRFLHISGSPELQLPFKFLLPSKLEILHIEDCSSPFLLVELHNLNSLQQLNITGCPELQLSPEEFLPSNLRMVKISYCMKLTSTLRFQNASSLEFLEIAGCPQLQLSPNDSLPVNLVRLCIEDCLRLTSLVGLRYLRSLWTLRISHCPELQLPLDESLPTSLWTMFIIDCPKLTSVEGLQDLSFLQRLYFARCQRLQLIRDIPLPSMPDYLEIVGCPGLREWCNRNGYEYKEKLSIVKKRTVSNIDEIITLYEMRKLASLQHLQIRDCELWPPYFHWMLLPSTLQNLELVSCRFEDVVLRIQSSHHGFCRFQNSLPHLPQGLHLLQRLRIQRCKDLYAVEGLHQLASLQNLVICDCPELYTLGQLLPPTITSFTVNGCGNLVSLPLLHQNLSTLKELHITNCCNLTSMTGLNNVTSIQTLWINQCPKLHLSPDEILSSSTLENVEVYDCPGLMDWCQTNRIPIVQMHERIREIDDENMIDDGNLESEMTNLQMKDSSSHPPIIEFFDSTDEDTD